MKKKSTLTTRTIFSNSIQIVLGILSALFGLKGFLLSSHFIDGGVTGVSMLLSTIFNIPISISIFVINVPFLWLGYNKLGTLFAIKSFSAIAGLALALAFINVPDVTSDKLLTAVFGGIFIGVGIALAIRGGAVLDGTEIAALLVSKKAQIVKVSDVILMLNVLIFGTAAFFLGIERALYSVLTYLAASKMIDFILNGIEQYTGITVISTKSELIRRIITHQLGRGVTIYQGKSGYGKDGEINDTRDIVFTVATRLEVPSIRQVILEVDPKAFIVLQSIEDTTGGLLKRKGLH
ncbi:YitT family protein [Mucilaginibacter limnophilus]|uniref:YitT family protein n=1 Tax=Mucilaginibacter limnophilus TaxID=1932778 RepID=A0A437MZG9_9SPHI|nr:YitT family protein [Mucilaginibacter limnophilus]RVU03065.1 YitT family protein [Mucilaginibacter limnophilus]